MHQEKSGNPEPTTYLSKLIHTGGTEANYLKKLLTF
jgi:hypothetical protein